MLSLALLQATRFGFTLAVAAAIPPESFTTWALVLAAMVYLPGLTLGAINGMGRELPYLVGSGRASEVDSAEATAWITVAAGVLAIGVGTAALTPSLGLVDTGWIGAVLALSLIFQTQQSALRSRLRFRQASLHQGAFAVFVLVATGAVALGSVRSLAAAATAYAAATVPAVALGVWLHRPPLGGGDREHLGRLLRVGLPLTAAAAGFGLFTTSDRWTATAVLGPAEAAPYALASVVGSALLVLSAGISQQFYPRMALAWGETESAPVVLDLAREQGRIALMLALPAAAAVSVLGLAVIPLALPQYEGAAFPVAAVATGLAVQSAFTGFGNFLNVVGAHAAYLRVQGGAIVLGVAPMAFGALVGGVSGLAVGAASVFVAYGLALRTAGIRVSERAQRTASR